MKAVLSFAWELIFFLQQKTDLHFAFKGCFMFSSQVSFLEVCYWRLVSVILYIWISRNLPNQNFLLESDLKMHKLSLFEKDNFLLICINKMLTYRITQSKLLSIIFAFLFNTTACVISMICIGYTKLFVYFTSIKIANVKIQIHLFKFNKPYYNYTVQNVLTPFGVLYFFR